MFISPEPSTALTEVADGGAAQLAYLEMVDPQTSRGRKDALERALRIDCRRDTEGMVRITRRLAMNGPT